MLDDLLGPPQVAALLVLLQRALEELYSARNTRRLLAEGAREVGRAYYPVVVVTHLAWIAGLFFFLPPAAPVSLPFLGLFLFLQVARYWVIGALGRYWTHRIITLKGAPIVRRGPYRYFAHPNYAVVIAETLVLPLVFAGWALAIIMTAISSAVLYYKSVIEDLALAERKSAAVPDV